MTLATTEPWQNVRMDMRKQMVEAVTDDVGNEDSCHPHGEFPQPSSEKHCSTFWGVPRPPKADAMYGYDIGDKGARARYADGPFYSAEQLQACPCQGCGQPITLARK